VTQDEAGQHSELLDQLPHLRPPHNTRWPGWRQIEELRKQVPAEERDAEDKRRNEEQAKLLLACLHIKGEPMIAVKLDDARRVISAAEKKAREIGQPMNIAVADEGGNIVAHVRMDNAWIGSIDISMKKAYTSRI
jgi:hypothetical protein